MKEVYRRWCIICRNYFETTEEKQIKCGCEKYLTKKQHSIYVSNLRGGRAAVNRGKTSVRKNYTFKGLDHPTKCPYCDKMTTIIKSRGVKIYKITCGSPECVSKQRSELAKRIVKESNRANAPLVMPKSKPNPMQGYNPIE